ncbi:prolyl aminopeptidase [Bacteriovorax sp. Seq25_V]|uniref:prolyl aminopeptidase n=1 Tax=Bacteriovorax sp. Seq25_V TaxID=1201288 RepID=UPI000389F6B8|nr:prolyl aminopeptidase [Bacteriovorax sp. Seq25_V]EQC45577.1 prolyl aminopeptidase [Bacteriovorax sp. Seq25_V]
MRTLYPEITPRETGHLKVSEIHNIYYEVCGNPDGKSVVFLHGGPGGGIDDNYRQYFDPEKYNIVLFDQRGCGRSTPFAELKENTTWDLVADIEKLRNHLSINTWAVFGGSWGSTLALAYAQTHPSSVEALFLRGIFMLRQKELKWFYQDGASYIYPDAWEFYRDAIPESERGDFISAYYKRLTSDDKEIRSAAAKAWSIWEASTSKLIQDKALMEDFGDDEFADAFARIECHFFTNKGFFECDDQILRDVDKIRHIPAIIVQGRYDVVCPMTSAWDLHRAWPEAKFEIIQDAGHSLSEKGIRSCLIEATDRYVNTGNI